MAAAVSDTKGLTSKAEQIYYRRQLEILQGVWGEFIRILDLPFGADLPDPNESMGQRDAALVLARHLADAQETGHLRADSLSMVERNHGWHNIAWFVVKQELIARKVPTSAWSADATQFFLYNAPYTQKLKPLIDLIPPAALARWPTLLRRDALKTGATQTKTGGGAGGACPLFRYSLTIKRP
jgi:hypothetical protein